MAASMVDCEVCSPDIISTPFWTGTGFMKCVPITRDGAARSLGSLVVAAAMVVIDIEEVFVPRMACLGHISASIEKSLVLRLDIS